MAFIRKQDTDNSKGALVEGELGYDKQGADRGRVYVGTDTGNVPLASKSEVDTHVADTGNPHDVTKTQVGLGNVTNDAQLKVSSNLSDLNNAATARTNLGLSNHNLITVASDSKTTFPNDITIGGTALSEASLKILLSVDKYSFSWDSATSTPASAFGSPRVVSPIHEEMRRCVVGHDGVRKYYLHPTNSTLKEDGTAAIIDGTDGQVMVEIPKFYSKYVRQGTLSTWAISSFGGGGFNVHPAFIRNGVEVPYRYISAYDVGVRDVSAGINISGLNLDTATGLVDLANDYLISASGVYPMVGLTRNEFRTLATNVGVGWSLGDFWLHNAITLLYLIEYQTFNSQSVLGTGNVNSGYLGSSSNQNDSPHTIAGASNSWGNVSTDGTQPSAGARPGTAYMSYRGIENWFGNTWNFVDGYNVNNRQAYVSNTLPFVDDTTTGYTALGSTMPSTHGYVTNHQDVEGAFLQASVGGSSSTYWTDYYWQTTGWTVALIGSAAHDYLLGGALYWLLGYSAASRSRNFSARLAL